MPGMTLAVEPMINLGRADVAWLDDEWTVVNYRTVLCLPITKIPF